MSCPAGPELVGAFVGGVVGDLVGSFVVGAFVDQGISPGGGYTSLSDLRC